MTLQEKYRERFLTQKQVAAKIGVKQNTLAQWLLERPALGPEKLRQLEAIIDGENAKQIAELLEAFKELTETAKIQCNIFPSSTLHEAIESSKEAIKNAES